MTFIEAAIEILRQVGRPLPVRELTERSIKQNLLSHLGRTPEATMQTRLAAEAKKGDRTPLVQKGQGVFGLRRYDRPKPPAGAKSIATKPVPARTATSKPVAAAKAKVEEDGEGGKRRRRRRGGKDKSAGPEPVAPEMVEEGTPEEAILAERLSEGEAPDGSPGSLRSEGPAPGAPREGPTATDTDADTAPPLDADSATDTDTDMDTDTAAVRPATHAPSRLPDAPAAAPSIDLDALRPVEPRRYPRIVELPTDETLAAEYADEIASGSVAPPAASEVIDSQSADEDRLLHAEIKDDRDRRGRRHGRDRTKDDKKEGRRGQRDPKAQQAQQAQQGQAHQKDTSHHRGQRDPKEHKVAPHPQASRHPQAPAAQHRHAPSATQHTPAVPPPPSQQRAPTPPLAAPPTPAPMPMPMPMPPATSVPTSLREPRPPASSPLPALPIDGRAASVADVAVGLLRALNDPRPIHARQLAAMAVKRKLLAGDPEDLWRIIRVALAADARDRQSAGLRPRARALSGGLFALATGRLDDAVRAAEDALGARVEELTRATREGLRAAVGRLSLGALEQLARLHLERSGFRDIERVKRTGQSGFETSYLVATHARGKFLVGARTGGTDVGRHSVGELRAGVEAKGSAEGLLLAAGRLGPDATRELVAPGPIVNALVGEELGEALVREGIGVVRAAVSVAYLDLDLLVELGE